MAAKLEKTSTPGIFRRHAKGVRGRSAARARTSSSGGTAASSTRRRSGPSRRRARRRERATPAIAGRSRGSDSRTTSPSGSRPTRAGPARGFSETTRPEYRRPDRAARGPAVGHLEAGGRRAGGRARPVRRRCAKSGATTSAIKKLRAALSAMFATAVEDGLLRSNPVRAFASRRHRPATSQEDEQREGADARRTGARARRRCPRSWRLFFEFLTHTGLRISEAIGLTWQHVELGTRPRVLVREQVYRGERRRLKSAPRTPRHPALAGDGASDSPSTGATRTAARTSRSSHRRRERR